MTLRRKSGPAVADRTLKIYVFDDDEPTATALGRMFTKGLGAEVRRFSTTRSLLAAARSEPPDLITTDLIHPGQTGPDLVRLLRKDARTRDVPVWIISGQAESPEFGYGQMVQRARHHGVDFVATKPWQSRELVGVARRTLLPRTRPW